MSPKRPSHVLIALAALAACAALLLGACGSDDDGDSGTTGSTGTAPSATASDSGTASGEAPATGESAPPVPGTPGGAPGGAPAAPAPPANLNKRLAVPDVVGDSLADAQSKIKAAGLVFTAESTDGDRSAIQSSWEVCSTVPSAGKKIAAGAPIAVIAAPPGSC